MTVLPRSQRRVLRASSLTTSDRRACSCIDVALRLHQRALELTVTPPVQPLGAVGGTSCVRGRVLCMGQTLPATTDSPVDSLT